MGVWRNAYTLLRVPDSWRMILEDVRKEPNLYYSVSYSVLGKHHVECTMSRSAAGH